MNLKNELDKSQIELLESINIEIENKEYTIDDTGKIIDLLDDAIHDHLNSKLDYTEKSIKFEEIQDRIIELENKID